MKATLDNFLSPLMANRITNFQTMATLSLSCPPYFPLIAESPLTIGVTDVNRLAGDGRQAIDPKPRRERHAGEEGSGRGDRAHPEHDEERAGASGRRSDDRGGRPDAVPGDSRDAGEGLRPARHYRAPERQRPGHDDQDAQDVPDRGPSHGRTKEAAYGQARRIRDRS